MITRKTFFRAILFAFSALSLSSAGCGLPPDSAPWRQDQKTIQAVQPQIEGTLIVETQEAGSPQDGEQPHERYFVYEESGRYLTYFPNDHFLPIRLPIGRYVVISRYRGKNKRVQVELKEGCTTYIRLQDFKEAPSAE